MKVQVITVHRGAVEQEISFGGTLSVNFDKVSRGSVVYLRVEDGARAGELELADMGKHPKGVIPEPVIFTYDQLEDVINGAMSIAPRGGISVDGDRLAALVDAVDVCIGGHYGDA